MSGENDFTTSIDRTGTASAKWLDRPAEGTAADTIPLSVADMELAVAPAIRAALHEAVDHGIYGYTLPDAEYFSTVTGWLSRRWGAEVDPAHIRVTPGVVPALRLAIRSLTEPDASILIQTPVYYPFRAVIEAAGRRVVENPLTRADDGTYAMDFDQLERVCVDEKPALMILCSPHNPVGRVWTSEELTRLRTICSEHDVIVVADEIHGDLIVGEKPFTSLLTLPGMERDTVVCTAPSKTFNLAGLMTSNIIIPDDSLRDRYSALMHQEGLFSIPYFGRVATMAAYTDGEGWLEDLLAHIRVNERVLREGLGRALPRLVFSPLEGTYLPWSDWRAYFDDAADLKRFMLHEAGVVLDEGHIFGNGGAGFERFNIAVPTSVLEDAVGRIVTAAEARGITGA